jgi:hypothetical protein
MRHAAMPTDTPEIADRLNKYTHGAHLKHKDIANLMNLCRFETIAYEPNRYAHGAHLKHRDIPNLMSLCRFETVAYEHNSPWCGLFCSLMKNGHPMNITVTCMIIMATGA